MKRLVGYDLDSKELDASKTRGYLFGGHVANYMRYMMEEDEDKYKSHFSRYIKEGVEPDHVCVVLCCVCVCVNRLAVQFAMHFVRDCYSALGSIFPGVTCFCFSVCVCVCVCVCC